MLDTGSEHDILNGGEGSDRLLAGYGDDVYGGAVGHPGFDFDVDSLVISLRGAPAGVTVDFGPLVGEGSYQITIGGGTITGIDSIDYIEGSDFGDTITGPDASSTTPIFGLGGDDRLIAGSTFGPVYGGAGDDHVSDIESGSGAELYGDDGADIIEGTRDVYGGAGDDVLTGQSAEGGSGDDVITLADSVFTGTARGQAGNDRISGSNGRDTLIGGGGSDQLEGGAGDDRIYGADGPNGATSLYESAEYDRIYGGDGNDLLHAGFGDDIDGGAGVDTLSLDASAGTSGIAIDLTGGTGMLSTGNGGVVRNVEAIATLIGTSFDDVITLGSAGGTIVAGGAGNDRLTAGRGRADLSGGLGADILLGGDAADVLAGGSGADLLKGGAGDDALDGGDDDDVLDGGPGNDTIYGGAGFDSVSYATAQTGIIARSTGGGMIVSIGAEQDVVVVERVVGSQFDDRFEGTHRADTIEGGGGNDVLDGLGGDDMLVGGDGNDTYVVDSRADIVIEAGGEGFDEIVASASFALGSQSIERIRLTGFGHLDVTGSDDANQIVGNSGNNRLEGAGGADRIDGMDGNDTLIGGAGADELRGGRGDDTYVVDAGDVVEELAGEGYDTVRTALGRYDLRSQFEALVFTGVGAFTGIGNAAANLIDASAGGGADLLDGGAGADQLVGGQGDDRYIVDNAGDRVFEVPGGGDDLVESSVSFSLAGQAVERLTLTGTGAINATGNALDNVLIGNAAANSLDGGDGADRMEGGLGDDLLLGGAGDDTLSGGAGIDRLTGGAGADVFRDTAAGLNGDTITDFAWGDTLHFTDRAMAGFVYSRDGGTLTYTGGTLTLAGLPANAVLRAAAGGSGGVELTLAPRVENDFNGDGRSDILWRHASGMVTTWSSTASGFVGSATTVPVSTDWRIAGTADFDGDGRSDLLWRHANGMVTGWQSTVSGFVGSPVTALVSNDWQIAGTGDFSGDGRADVLWRNANGTVTDWLSTGSGFVGNDAASQAAAPDWTVQNTNSDVLI